MKTILDRWNRFWFEPATADNLGLARLMLYGSMGIFYLLTPVLFPTWGWHVKFSQWGGVDPVFWQPIWLFRTLHLPQFSVQTIALIDAVWKVSLILSAIGLFTRASTWTSFFLGIYLFGISNNFGKTHHLDILLLWAFFAMAMSRCGDAWSIDRLIRVSRSEGKLALQPPVFSGDYTWPIRLIWVAMSMIYFEAGVSKLRHSGLQWVTSDIMSFFMLRAQYHVTDAEPLTHWGLFIATHAWASHLMALMGLSLEFFYPLALFSKRLRWIIVPSGAMMQIGIAVLMGPNFYQMIICQFIWLPLDRLVAPLCRYGQNKPKYSLIYDGSCGLCQRTMGVVRSLDLLSRVQYFNALADWPAIQQRFPQLDQQRCLDDMHAIDTTGKVRVGFDAYRGLAWMLPMGWLLLPVFYFPGASIIGPRIYRRVADSRHQHGCALPANPVATAASQ